MRCMSRTAIGSIAAGLLTACAHGAARSRATDTAGVSAATVVTAEELQRVGQGRSVFAALEQVRPWLLTARGGVPSVSVDGSSPTDVSLLRSMSVSDVCEVRLLRATSDAGRSAVLANGDVRNTGDIILVLTRPACRSGRQRWRFGTRSEERSLAGPRVARARHA